MLRSHARSAKTLLAVSALVAVAACGGGSSAADNPTTPPASAPEPGGVLLASVGNAEDPEAYDIALTGEDGTPVTTLPAGTYTIEVSDPSRIHNWALTGEGVSVATSVSGTGDETFEVTFVAGDYSYVCDPHPSMNGTITVV